MEIELLAPAANFESGVAAINAGADALYIGGPAFGARSNAGNSVEEIAKLTQYAHQFGVRVYLALNTILYDNETAEAQRLIWQLWDAGIDAIIIQDMGILEMSLPPIQIHASTQTTNMSPERVQFLQNVGFDRVILERGLSLAEIQLIRSETSVELEAFVHGAICVGYSGQCYLSQALCGRSGNRGRCAQSCRSEWRVVHSDGTVVSPGGVGMVASQSSLTSKVSQRGTTILSVGDLDLSDNLDQIIAAGITSLKIEGRLKDQSYVINNVAYYNQKLNALGVARTSFGRSTPTFVPNPVKSFSRSFSNYLFIDRHPTHSLLNQSQGEYLGTVSTLGPDYFTLDASVVVNNGDGISFANSSSTGRSSSGKSGTSTIGAGKSSSGKSGFGTSGTSTIGTGRSSSGKSSSGKSGSGKSGFGTRSSDTSGLGTIGTGMIVTNWSGTNVNTTVGDRIYSNRMEGIEVGAKIHRNLDRAFRPTSNRRIDVEIFFNQDRVTAQDSTGVEVAIEYTSTQAATDPDRARIVIATALGKSGGTIFNVTDVTIDSTPHLASSQLNEIRRRLLEQLLIARKAAYTRAERQQAISHPELKIEIDYRYNVANALARKFYEKCGATSVSTGYELESVAGAVLLRTRHCIRRELGHCLKERGVDRSALFIENNGRKFALDFDCANCEMVINAD